MVCGLSTTPSASKRLPRGLLGRLTQLLRPVGIRTFVIAFVCILLADSLIGVIGYHIVCWWLSPPHRHGLWLLFNPFFYPLMSLEPVRKWYRNVLRAMYPSYSVAVDISIVPYDSGWIPECKYIRLTPFHKPLLIATLMHVPYWCAMSYLLALMASWYEGRIEYYLSKGSVELRGRGTTLRACAPGIIMLVLGASLIASSFIQLTTVERPIEGTFEVEAGSYRLLSVNIVPEGWEERITVRGVLKVVEGGDIKFWKGLAGFVGGPEELLEFYFTNIEWRTTEITYQRFKLELGGNYTGPIYFILDNTYSQAAKTVYLKATITRIRSCRYLEGPGFILWMAGIIGIAVGHAVSSKSSEQESF